MTKPPASDVLLIAIGSSGDVNPFVAIGCELSRRGHGVSLMANGHFESLVRRAGLNFVERGTAQEYDEVIRDTDMWHPTRSFERMADFGFIKPIRAVYETIQQRFAESQRLVVVHSTLAVAARLAQERLGIPTVTVNLSPSVFRSSYRHAALPGLWMPQWLPRRMKRAVYRLGDWLVVDRLLTRPINLFRRELGLPPVRHVLDGWLHSPWLTLGAWPPWFAPAQPDWPESLAITGFPLFDGVVAPGLPDELVAWLESWPQPIVFTFGSAMVQASDCFAASAEACQRLQRPGILLTPYADQIPDTLPQGVHHVPLASLNELLPFAGALVHHGGVGTTAAAMAAGVPQLIVPMAFDQFDNAQRAVELGLGRSIRRSKYNGASAAEALAHLINAPHQRSACQSVAKKIDRQAGVIAACDAIEGGIRGLG